MGKALADRFDVCRQTFQEADDVLGERLSALCFGAKRVIPLQMSAPFHCALMKPAETRLAPELRALTNEDPATPIVANVDGNLKRTGPSAIDALILQVSAPVQWEGVVKRLASEGVTRYVEVGPGTVRSGLVRKIHREAEVRNFGSPDDLAIVEALSVG
jgi:[acyl-carrier-protein] S-malonyltransferase